MLAREVSLAARLRAVGIQQISRAEGWINRIENIRELSETEHFWSGLKSGADPDQVLLGLVNLVEGSDQLTKRLVQDTPYCNNLCSLLGVSRFFADYLVTHPKELEQLNFSLETESFWDRKTYRAAAEKEKVLFEQQEYYRGLLQAVQGTEISPKTWVAGPGTNFDQLRRVYRRYLLQIAAQDATHPDPLAYLSLTARRLAALTDATLEAALALARREYDPQAQVRFTIMAMGKTGANELNYLSDIDVIYVAEPTSALSEAEALEVAKHLVMSLSATCSMPGQELPLWTLDANLRPEGKHGAVCRSVQSHYRYYQKWAKNWEFQALLKARPAAGDQALGQAYLEKITPLVWNAVERENFIEDARKMRAKVESQIPKSLLDREIKLGPGGLRDIEFSVQLLQLVHGRTAEALRGRSTLGALQALADGGYIGRDPAGQLADAYRFLRVVEHRMQLERMQRTHLFPCSDQDLRRVARSLKPNGAPSVEQLKKRWLSHKGLTRKLQQEIFYRPLLPAMAQLSKAQVTLSPQDSQERLKALGYQDPKGAIQHIQALTRGVSRRANIQKQVLPVLLQWFSNGADPDAGLLRFRHLSETIGDSHWYMGLLRDSSTVAKRLCTILTISSYISTRLEHVPEAVAWLDNDQELSARPREELFSQMEALTQRHQETSRAIELIREVRGREFLRVALKDCVDHLDPLVSQQALTSVNDAALQASANVILRELRQKYPVVPALILVSLGRGGGAEYGYASDADLLVVHDLVSSDSGGGKLPSELGAKVAIEFATRLRAELRRNASAPILEVDYGLRPEGEAGGLSRSLEAYGQYYQRWSSPWERQALLRARVIWGDESLSVRFSDLMDQVRYQPELTDSELKEIRRLKARMEKERISPRQNRNLEVKLGPGGLSDVEWVAQLYQLRYAGKYRQLRTTNTIAALNQLGKLGFFSAHQVEVLSEAWLSAMRVRNGNALISNRLKGKKLDYVPTDALPRKALGHLLGYCEHDTLQLIDDYLRRARRARRVAEDLFFNS